MAKTGNISRIAAYQGRVSSELLLEARSVLYNCLRGANFLPEFPELTKPVRVRWAVEEAPFEDDDGDSDGVEDEEDTPMPGSQADEGRSQSTSSTSRQVPRAPPPPNTQNQRRQEVALHMEAERLSIPLSVLKDFEGRKGEEILGCDGKYGWKIQSLCDPDLVLPDSADEDVDGKEKEEGEEPH